MVANVWVAAGAGNWSDDANWSLGHSPIAGEDPTFDGTSVNNCTADDSTPTGVLTIAAGYSGTITQSSDMYISGYSQAAGTLSTNLLYTMYLSGNYTKTGGTPGAVKLVTSGIDKIISSHADMGFWSITNTGSITIQGGLTYLSCGNVFNNSGTINLVKKLWLIPDASVTYTYVNTGIIQGTGTLEIRTSISRNLDLGVVNCPLILSLKNNASANRIYTLINDLVCSSSLSITDYDTTETLTLDLNGHSLTASSITVGTRGILQCGEGTITTGSLDSSAGAITEETAKWIFNGTGNLKMAAGQKLYDVITRAKANVTMLSDVEVSNELIRCADNIREGAFALTMDCPDKLFDRHRIRHKVDYQRNFEPEPGDLIYSLPKRREAVTSE